MISENPCTPACCVFSKPSATVGERQDVLPRAYWCLVLGDGGPYHRPGLRSNCLWQYTAFQAPVPTHFSLWASSATASDSSHKWDTLLPQVGERRGRVCPAAAVVTHSEQPRDPSSLKPLTWSLAFPSIVPTWV